MLGVSVSHRAGGRLEGINLWICYHCVFMDLFNSKRTCTVRITTLLSIRKISLESKMFNNNFNYLKSLNLRTGKFTVASLCLRQVLKSDYSKCSAIGLTLPY